MVVVDPTIFVRSEQLRDEAMGGKLKPFHQWQAYSNKLRRDPSLLAYYDFQPRGMGGLRFFPMRPAMARHRLMAIVTNATWASGRMLGKHSLLFQGASDHVAVDIPEKIDDLSLLAWVCMWRIENPLGALLASESWERTGQMHWQVDHDGAVWLTLWNGKNYTYKSAPIFLAAQLSRWVQTGVVYDHRARLVKFYHNGQLISAEPIKKHVPICIGRAWIGNWRVGDLPEDPHDPSNVRNFRGRIDELAIFRRALSDEEVRRAFEAERLVATDSESGGAPAKSDEETAVVKESKVQSERQ